MAAVKTLEMKLRPADYVLLKKFDGWWLELSKYLAAIQFKVRFQTVLFKLLERAASIGTMSAYEESKEFSLLGMQVAEFLFKLNPAFEVYKVSGTPPEDYIYDPIIRLRSSGRTFPLREYLDAFYYKLQWNIYAEDAKGLPDKFVQYSLDHMSNYIIAMYEFLQTKATTPIPIATKFKLVPSK